MTKEQLISLFPSVANHFLQNAVLCVAVAMIIGGLATVWLRSQHEALTIVGIGATAVLFFLGVYIAVILDQGQKDILQAQKNDWKKISFYGKYLPTVPEEKFSIATQILNENGTITIVLNSKHTNSDSTITQVSNIKYFIPNAAQQEMYATSRWVEGLDAVEVRDGFYDTIIYLPQK
jgi:hypothetical protein